MDNSRPERKFKSKQQNKKGSKGKARSDVQRFQPKKDSRSKRVNFDNESKADFDAKYVKRTDNDISWYTKNPELMRAAASYYNFIPTGTKMASKINYRTPGIMSLYLTQNLSPTAVQAINVAGDAQYSFIVHANSRNTTYEAVDLMQIEIAAANLFAFYALGVRAYGLARNYNGANKYQVDGLLSASGFDPADIRSNLSTMWYGLNDFAAQLHQIWIPNTMSFVDRWFWINTNVYMDAESRKGQFYIMSLELYQTYDPKANSSGGALKWVKKGGGMISQGVDTSLASAYTTAQLHTWEEYRKTMQFMIDQLMSVEDRGVIMGDILKAFGPEKIFAVHEIPVDYKVEPVYNTEVLTQIENATCFAAGGYFQVNQNGGKLEPYYGQNTSATAINYGLQLPSQVVLNFHSTADPTPEQIVIATRLTAAGYSNISNASNTNATLSPGTAGTEYVNAIWVWRYDTNDTLQHTSHNSFNSAVDANIAWYSAFDWAPLLYTTTVSGAPGKTNGYNLQDVTVQTVIGDLSNATVIDMDTLEKIHRMCIFSEFDVPVQI